MDGPPPAAPWVLGAAAAAESDDTDSDDSAGTGAGEESVATRAAAAEERRLLAVAAALPRGTSRRSVAQAANAAEKAGVEAAWVANTNATEWTNTPVVAPRPPAGAEKSTAAADGTTS
jgi:hypothetical protein